LLNVLVQIANKMGLQKKTEMVSYDAKLPAGTLTQLERKQSGAFRIGGERQTESHVLLLSCSQCLRYSGWSVRLV
jgi:hypothetical protein